jgi:succinate dehydrogenase hydrophobic anchor subunit
MNANDIDADADDDVEPVDEILDEIERDDADGDDDADETPDDAEVAVDDERPWTWHLVRVTGFLLAIAIPVHFVVVMIVNDVGAATAASMNKRLTSVPWRVFEWAVLMLALVHGFLAASAFIERSRARDRVKEASTVSLGVLAVLLALAASAVLLSHR